ncbi:MAG: peroxide stress protein YaaA [Flavobacteriaceae bacterium]|nr:peroxide stress protein YaaA [Flavobacteriaceae bacterium]
MKVLLSPAKSLDFESTMPPHEPTQPIFKEKTLGLVAELKKMSSDDLAALMHISNKLAQLNFDRYQQFDKVFNTDNSRPALFAFNGDVYNGLDAYRLKPEALENAQHKILILSGLYGVLRPLDLMQAYRLEMGTNWGIGTAKNLYEYWKEQITDYLLEHLKKHEVIINLASQEYANVVDRKKLEEQHLWIEPVFKDFKNGKLKVISFYAKKARGMMARFIVENDLSDPIDLHGFNSDGYSYSNTETKHLQNPVFVG